MRSWFMPDRRSDWLGIAAGSFTLIAFVGLCSRLALNRRVAPCAGLCRERGENRLSCPRCPVGRGCRAHGLVSTG
jgi:hypothetical protein